MRLIDADMLIKKYIDTDIEKFSNSDIKIVLENLKQNILKAPIIEPKQEWIPCSERLPEAGVTVLVSSEGGYVYTSNMRHGEWEYGGRVVAWMPLPEPYMKGADNESLL